MAAPTEEDIRAAIARYRTPFDLNDAVTTVVGIVDVIEPESDYAEGYADRIWTNLEPSEHERLNELLDEVYSLANQFEKRVIEATVQAALTFAAEYPDAPRARVVVAA